MFYYGKYQDQCFDTAIRNLLHCTSFGYVLLAGGGDFGARQTDCGLPRRARRQGSGDAARRGDDAARSLADVPDYASLSGVFSREAGPGLDMGWRPGLG